MPKIFTDRNIYIIFVILFILQILFISPWGEFALNDDWVHSLAIYNFLNSGHLDYPHWLSPNSHLNIFYGILFTKVFGFSFSLLRFTNLFFSFTIIIFFYKFLRNFETKPLIAALLSLLLWFNPIFFNLSYTFMGDIPALLLLLFSIYFYYSGFKNSKNKKLFLGSCFAVLGFFVRQVNIFLLFAAGLYFLIKKGFKWKQIFHLFVLPFFILVIVYFILYKIGAIPGAVGSRFLPEGWSYTRHIITNIWHFILLLSFFSLPISLSLFFKNFSWLKTKKFWLLLCFAGIFFVIALLNNHLFPGMGNIINIFGLGPSLSVLQGDLSVWGNNSTYVIINIILVFGAVINSFLLFDKKLFQEDMQFSYIFFVIYLLTIVSVFSFDRYLLILLPIILLYYSRVLKLYSWSISVFLITLFIFIIYSTIGTYNYLSWNKIRWNLADNLVESGVSKKDIEAGYEWNGWNIYNSSFKLNDTTPVWAPWYIKELTPGHHMKYIISFEPLGGYELLDKKMVPSIFSNIKYLYLNKVSPGSLD